MSEYVLVLLISAAVTYLLTPLVRRVAIRAGALHEARDRDVHVVPIPLLGGLAMYAGLAAGLLVAARISGLRSAFVGSHTLGGLLAAGAVIVAVGVIDDRFGMSPLAKAAGQVAAGVLVVYSGAEISWLPLPKGGAFLPSPAQEVALTVLVVVATINAVNFIDGLDGLAAGIVTIAAVAFFVYYYTLTGVLHLAASAAPALVSALLAGICLGFLPHNFYPARIFMGDTGAMLLGLLLAYVVTSSITSIDPHVLTNPGMLHHGGTVNRFPEVLPLLLPAAFLVIPYADMLLAVVRRTRAGQSPFAPDRKHLHHRLLDIGHSHRSSVLIMYLWAALFCGTVVLQSIVRTQLFILALTTLAAIVVLLLLSMPRLRWWRRSPGARHAAPAAAAAPAPAVPAATASPVRTDLAARPAPAAAVAAAPVPAPGPAPDPGPAPNGAGTGPLPNGAGTDPLPNGAGTGQSRRTTAPAAARPRD